MRLSGCEYRKRIGEKRRKEQEVLEGTKRIYSFFVKKNSQPPIDVSGLCELAQSTPSEEPKSSEKGQDEQDEAHLDEQHE